MSTKPHPSHRAIAAAARANVPVLITGMPGEAKTASISSWADSWGWDCEVITGSSRDKGDFMGMPVEIDGEVIYSPPAWVRRLQNGSERNLLVIDEFTTAGEAYKLMLRIVQERVVGEATLAGGTSIIAIANPVEVAVDGADLPAPNANRFMHIDWHFDFAAWAQGLLTDFQVVDDPSLSSMLIAEGKVQARFAKVVGSIVAFLTNRPTLRSDCPDNPVNASAGWPSPRSWHNAAKVISHLREDDDEAVLLALKGSVGEGPAREYLAWVRTTDLIDPALAMEDPSIVDWHKARPDQLFALVKGVEALVTSAGSKTAWDKGMKVLVACAEGGKPDVATPSARTLLSRMPSGASMPAGTREAFESIMSRMPDRSRI